MSATRFSDQVRA